MTNLSSRFRTVRRLASCAILAMPISAVAQSPTPVQTQTVDAPDTVRILAKGEIDDGSETLDASQRLSLRASQERIWLRIEGAGGIQQDVAITVAIALVVLADRRLAFLWDALTDWGGPDLSRIRDAHIAVSRQALDATPPSDGSPARGQTVLSHYANATIAHAVALAAAGQHSEAVAIIRARLPSRLRRAQDQMDFSVLTSAMARFLRGSEDYIGAITVLESAGRQMGDSPYRANAEVNRAFALVRDGRFAEGLSAVDALLAATYSRGRRDITGSDRHFNLIRACALNGLGRTVEARTLAASVAQAPDAFDPRLTVEPSETVRMRMWLCMNDAPGVITELRRAIDARAYAALLPFVQPGYRPPGVSPDLLAAIRADPRIAAAADEHLRQLPEVMLAPLRQWRSAPQE